MSHRLRGDAGNAVLGFAFAGPFVALLAVAALHCTAVIWQRELAAARLQQEVAMAARIDGDRLQAAARLQTRLHALGLQPSPIDWEEAAVGAGRILTARVRIDAAGIGALPPIELQLASSAVLE